MSNLRLPYEKQFRSVQWVPKPIAEVFEFFCNEKNLETLTPPWLHFKVLAKSTEKIQVGTLIDYRLRIHGIPVQWQSEILEWEAERKFVDHQTKGPYAKWHHTHLFRAQGAKTEMVDEVVYQVPFGLLGCVFAGAFVRKDIQKIFAYRRNRVEEIFGRG